MLGPPKERSFLQYSVPEEKLIPSQRDEGWAEEWLYFHQPASQPAIQPASQPAKQSAAYLITDYIFTTTGRFLLKRP